MIYFLYLVHIVTCLFLILVVLLQQGKGADLSVFGGGTTQAAFGVRGAATLLHKLTVGCFVLFIVTTVSIGILQREGAGSSIMLDVEPTPAEEAATSDDARTPAEEPALEEGDGEAVPSSASDPPASTPDE